MKLLSQILLSLFTLYVSGCTFSPQEKETAKATPADTLIIPASTKPIDNDSVDENFSFPEEKAYAVKVLTAGQFHEDEVWPAAEKESWFGLFKSASAFYTAPTRITTTKVFDPVLDEDSLTDKTGWLVNAANSDTCLLLVSGIKLAQKEIAPVQLKQDKIYPGDTVSFSYSGTAYKIYATGKKKKANENSDWFEVSDYKLYIEAIKDGNWVQHLLVAQPRFDDQMVSIMFAGDIDGDGKLDLLIDTSNDYNMFRPTLYLSAPAEKGALLQVAGMHTAVGC